MQNIENNQILSKLSNCIRFLSIDAVQKAKSGHPGMPMGMADIATVLYKSIISGIEGIGLISIFFRNCVAKNVLTPLILASICMWLVFNLCNLTDEY